MNLRALLEVLTEPSNFKGDPYGGILNQWGHYSLGAAMYILACSFWFFSVGEMPDKWLSAVVMISFYFFIIELMLQGWKGKDTIQDSGFFALGVLTIATSVDELESSGWDSYVVVDVGSVTVFILCAIIGCMIYGLVRIRVEDR